MTRSLRSLSALAGTTLIALAAAAPAQAALGNRSVHCADSIDTTENAGYIACQGPLTGDISANQNNVVSFAGFGSFAYRSATNDDSEEVFESDPGAVRFGEISFVESQAMHFVVGLKGANSYSLYLFFGGEMGLRTLNFDTFGIVRGNGVAGPELSHAVLFTPIAAVPEPGTWALFGAGLAAMGFVAGRRRAR